MIDTSRGDALDIELGGRLCRPSDTSATMQNFWSLVLCAVAQIAAVEPAWRQTNALRTIDLTKSYVKESLAVIIENISKEPQSLYYLPVESNTTYSFLEAQIKGKDSSSGTGVKVMRDEAAWQIVLDKPTPPGEKLTLTIASVKLQRLAPSPSKIDQNAKQYLQFTASRYIPSFYVSEKEKTKIKLPSADIPSFTQGGERQGNVLVYGPFESVSSNAQDNVSVRFEHTSPISTIKYFERDIEISHWGGNIAFEQRYALTNDGANLKAQFDRIAFAQSAFYNPQSSAIKNLVLPLPIGTRDAYFTDEIGNVSTSKFRSSSKEANLELKPRYPIFGGWNYTFTVGWNNDLTRFLSKTGSTYFLQVPFIEGADDLNYVDSKIRVILPEGAKMIKVSCPVPINAEQQYKHKTFMDTIGRSVVQLDAQNLVSEKARQQMTIEYEYGGLSVYRKPLVVITALSGLFTASAVLSKVF